MTEIVIFSFLGLLLLTLFCIFVYIELSEKRLDPQIIKTANLKIKETEKLDPNLSLIESHKIMVNTLKTVFKNKKLNSAKVLNKVSKNFKDKKEFWFYHRMRNKVAHENDYKITKKDSIKD